MELQVTDFGFALRDSCESPLNDGYFTHPLTPSAREGDFFWILRFAQNDKNKILCDSSAEGFLGDFVGFGVRGYEIRLMVYRIAEHEQSRKSVKKPIALY